MRRDEIVEAALAEFAERGLHGATTAAIAARAGISQPYVFRFFETKKALFLAALELSHDRTLATWQAAAAKVGRDDPQAFFRALGRAYRELLSDRRLLLAQLQGYAACADPDVRRTVQRQYRSLMGYVERASGADRAMVQMFFAHGMLLNVAAIAGLDEISARPPWAGRSAPPDAPRPAGEPGR